MKNLLIFLLVCSSSAQARAILLEDGGSSVGSGGYSVVCWNQLGVSGAEALDLYEGRMVNGYSYPDHPGLNALQVARIFAEKLDASFSISPGSPFGVVKKLEFVAAHTRFLPPGAPLKQSHDSRFELKSSECKMVQTVNFNSSIDFSATLWPQHNITNQAALLVHEALYWYMREIGKEVDSRRVRRVVSYLFAGGELSPINPKLPESISNSQECFSKPKGALVLSTAFTAFVDESGELRIQFKRIAGFKVVAETTLRSNQNYAPNSLVLNKDLPSLETVYGNISSISDSGTELQLTWGQGNIKLTGMLQGEFPVNEEIRCMTWKKDPGEGSGI